MEGGEKTDFSISTERPSSDKSAMVDIERIERIKLNQPVIVLNKIDNYDFITGQKEASPSVMKNICLDADDASLSELSVSDFSFSEGEEDSLPSNQSKTSKESKSKSSESKADNIFNRLGVGVDATGKKSKEATKSRPPPTNKNKAKSQTKCSKATSASSSVIKRERRSSHNSSDKGDNSTVNKTLDVLKPKPGQEGDHKIEKLVSKEECNNKNWRYDLRLIRFGVPELNNESFRKFINLASDCAVSFTTSSKLCHGTVCLYFGDYASLQSALQKLGQVSFTASDRIQVHIVGKRLVPTQKQNCSTNCKWSLEDKVNLYFTLHTDWTNKLKQAVQVRDWKKRDKKNGVFVKIAQVPTLVSKEILSLLFPFSLNIRNIPTSSSSSSSGKTRFNYSDFEVEFATQELMESVLHCFQHPNVSMPKAYLPSTKLIVGFKLQSSSFASKNQKDMTFPYLMAVEDNKQGRLFPCKKKPQSVGGGSHKGNSHSTSQGGSSQAGSSHGTKRAADDTGRRTLSSGKKSRFSQPDEEAENGAVNVEDLKRIAKNQGFDPSNRDALCVLEIQRQLSSLQCSMDTSVQSGSHLSSQDARLKKILRENITLQQQQLQRIENQFLVKKNNNDNAVQPKPKDMVKAPGKLVLPPSLNNQPLDFNKPQPRVEQAVKADEIRTKLSAVHENPASFKKPAPVSAQLITLKPEDCALPLGFGKNVEKVSPKVIGRQTADVLDGNQDKRERSDHRKRPSQERSLGNLSTRHHQRNTDNKRCGDMGRSQPESKRQFREQDLDRQHWDGENQQRRDQTEEQLLRKGAELIGLSREEEDRYRSRSRSSDRGSLSGNLPLRSPSDNVGIHGGRNLGRSQSQDKRVEGNDRRMWMGEDVERMIKDRKVVDYEQFYRSATDRDSMLEIQRKRIDEDDRRMWMGGDPEVKQVIKDRKMVDYEQYYDTSTDNDYVEEVRYPPLRNEQERRWAGDNSSHLQKELAGSQIHKKPSSILDKLQDLAYSGDVEQGQEKRLSAAAGVGVGFAEMRGKQGDTAGRGGLTGQSRFQGSYTGARGVQDGASVKRRFTEEGGIQPGYSGRGRGGFIGERGKQEANTGVSGFGEDEEERGSYSSAAGRGGFSGNSGNTTSGSAAGRDGFTGRLGNRGRNTGRGGFAGKGASLVSETYWDEKEEYGNMYHDDETEIKYPDVSYGERYGHTGRGKKDPKESLDYGYGYNEEDNWSGDVSGRQGVDQSNWYSAGIMQEQDDFSLSGGSKGVGFGSRGKGFGQDEGSAWGQDPTETWDENETQRAEFGQYQIGRQGDRSSRGTGQTDGSIGSDTSRGWGRGAGQTTGSGTFRGRGRGGFTEGTGQTAGSSTGSGILRGRGRGGFTEGTGQTTSSGILRGRGRGGFTEGTGQTTSSGILRGRGRGGFTEGIGQTAGSITCSGILRGGSTERTGQTTGSGMLRGRGRGGFTEGTGQTTGGFLRGSGRGLAHRGGRRVEEENKVGRGRGVVRGIGVKRGGMGTGVHVRGEEISYTDDYGDGQNTFGSKSSVEESYKQQAFGSGGSRGNARGGSGNNGRGRGAGSGSFTRGGAFGSRGGGGREASVGRKDAGFHSNIGHRHGEDASSYKNKPGLFGPKPAGAREFGGGGDSRSKMFSNTAENSEVYFY